MQKAKREKSAKYAGVYYRFDEKAKERTYYIMYRQGGRGAKLIEEPVGKSSSGMTEAKASMIRADRMRGKELPNTERRKEEAQAKAAGKERWTLQRIWDAYQIAHPEHKSRATDISRFNLYLSVFAHRLVAEISTNDIDQIRIGILEERIAALQQIVHDKYRRRLFQIRHRLIRQPNKNQG